MRSIRARRWVGLVSGLLLLAGVPGWWTATRPADAVGALPQPAADGPDRPHRMSTDQPHRMSTDQPRRMSRDQLHRTGPSRIGARPARIGDLETPPTVEPRRLHIDDIGVAADVVPVGTDRQTGAMEVPDDVSRIGWYRYGPSPGEAAGSAVLAGHVDSTGQGPGALFRLAELPPGAAVTVTLSDGGTEHYEVVARRRIPKAALGDAGVFDPGGEPMLVLITCGGDFDPVRRSYADNVVVWAAPAA